MYVHGYNATGSMCVECRMISVLWAHAHPQDSKLHVHPCMVPKALDHVRKNTHMGSVDENDVVSLPASRFGKYISNY